MSTNFKNKIAVMNYSKKWKSLQIYK